MMQEGANFCYSPNYAQILTTLPTSRDTDESAVFQGIHESTVKL